MPLAVADVRRALGGLIRAEVKAAAGADKQLQAGERDALSPFVKDAVSGLADGASVNAAVDAAMAKAMRTWAEHNQTSGRGAPLLSKKELAAIKKTEVGPLTLRAAELVIARLQPQAEPVVALKAPVPAGLTIEKHGDVYTLTATDAVPLGKIALTVDGKDLEVELYRRSFGTYDSLAPEGYGLEQVDHAPSPQGVSVGKFKITRDPPGSLTTDQAAVKAKEGLLEYLKNERIHDDDWHDYFPKTWAEVEADGAVTKLDELMAKRDHEFLGRKPDRYLWVGAGPYDLYTEVEVRKSDGKVLRTYIEID